MKKLIMLVVLLGLSGCGMELKPTEEKVYRNETKTMKLVKEHQLLQLDIMRINAAIAQINAKAEKNMPTFNLAPVESKETAAKTEARIRAKIEAEAARTRAKIEAKALAKAKAKGFAEMNKKSE